MCSPALPRGRARVRLRHAVVGVLVATLGLALLAPPAAAQDPRLQRAEAERDALQARLDEALQREHELAAEVEAARAELDALVAKEAEERTRADAARQLSRASGTKAHRRAGAGADDGDEDDENVPF